MAELINTLETFSDPSVLARPRLTVAEVHSQHGEFIWKTLYRMGVRSPHLEDVYQEVFLVVHRRLDSYAGHCAITTWLFEVCFRVAAGYRRRAHFRREQLVADAGFTRSVREERRHGRSLVESVTQLNPSRRGRGPRRTGWGAARRTAPGRRVARPPRRSRS